MANNEHEHIHESTERSSGMGIGMILGVLLVVVVLIFLAFFGFNTFQRGGNNQPAVEIPGKIDVNINDQGSQ